MVPVGDTGFFNDSDSQHAYEKRIIELKHELGKLYEEYVPLLHDNMIEELVRSEMLVKKYERMIVNDMESSPMIFRLLKDERYNLKRLRDDLEASLGKMREAKRDGGATGVNVHIVNQQIFQLVSLLRDFAAALPEEKREKFYNELERVEGYAGRN